MICQRCGIDYPVHVAAKRQQNGVDATTCSDCYILDAPPMQEYKGCRPWAGEVDDKFRPLRNGKLWKPGVRKCGHADCVKAAHIEGLEEQAEMMRTRIKGMHKAIEKKPPTKKKAVRPQKVSWELDSLDLELLLPGATALDLEAERTPGVRLNA